ncbi:MAG: ribbon-helix-helix protein, CopG family [Candidatus Bathyarchaeia archaeon]
MVSGVSKTTVEVDRATLQALKELKDELGVKSFDEAIRALIRQVRGIPKSKFGAHPDMEPFTAEDEATLHEL